MLKKSYSKTGRVCRVTFKVAAEVEADEVALCGDFNEWDENSNPMKQLKDGGFSTTVSIEAGRSYRFRYLINGDRWENDWEADEYWPNDFGSEDSVIRV
ncbi:MAG: isoamylase early set domain-containing protein [Candidatus Promineifilaceae bacterium]